MRWTWFGAIIISFANVRYSSIVQLPLDARPSPARDVWTVRSQKAKTYDDAFVSPKSNQTSRNWRWTTDHTADLCTLHSCIYFLLSKTKFFFSIHNFFEYRPFFMSVPSSNFVQFVSAFRTLSITVLGWGREDKKLFFHLGTEAWEPLAYTVCVYRIQNLMTVERKRYITNYQQYNNYVIRSSVVSVCSFGIVCVEWRRFVEWVTANKLRKKSREQSHFPYGPHEFRRIPFATCTHDELPGVSDYDKPAIIIVCNQKNRPWNTHSSDRTR